MYITINYLLATISRIEEEFEVVLLLQNFLKKRDVVQKPETIHTTPTDFSFQEGQHTVLQNKHSPKAHLPLDSNAVPQDVL